MFIALSCTVTYNGYHKYKKNTRESTPSRASVRTSTAQRMEPITPSFVQPWAPPSVQPSAPLSVEPSVPLSVEPSAPPNMETSEPLNPSTNGLPSKSKHDSNAPPSYESTLTELPTYETALTDTNPVN